ncbi:hypothetical protein [Streptomyces sp. NPDC050287]|uniref:hypothetical protein n=1 Tax=Streptomyces sp. NPDC050287 TaxID=3365608 RepID=UPI00378BA4BB
MIRRGHPSRAGPRRIAYSTAEQAEEAASDRSTSYGTAGYSGGWAWKRAGCRGSAGPPRT